jgi:hypothetical protein
MGDRFLARCVKCGQVVVVAERFGDPEFATLEDHLHTAHPELSDVVGTAAILQHFAVAREC